MTIAAKRSRVTPSATTALPTLPPALAETVLDFLSGDDYYHDNGRRYWSRQLAPLVTLTEVSQAWRALAVDRASQRVLATLRFKYKHRPAPATRSEMLEMRRILTLRRVHLRRVILEDLPDFGVIGEGVWHAALSHAPLLKLLDMDTGDVVRPPSRLVLDVTRAAARQCPLLESLMIPSSMTRLKYQHRDDDDTESHGNHMRAFADGVFQCLPQWAKHGGLKHLRMTMRERVHGRQRMHSYLDTITTHCPKIEIFDGFATALETVEIVLCEERWLADLASWERFCLTCDQLRLFDWVTVPFATRFFEMFAQKPKPQLTSLTLSTSGSWSWPHYFSTVGPTTKMELEASGYGGRAKHAHVVLQACPNLTDLRVEWFDMHLPGHQRGSKKSRVNPEIFGDDFCEAVATHCKKLVRLNHAPVRTDSPVWSLDAVVTLTDRSLRALATLPELSWVEIVGANITGDGLFDLVINHTASTRHERVYYFVLGDTKDGQVTSMVFYDVLKGFLERLLAYDGQLPCAPRPVMVQLENANKSVVDEAWSAAYFSSVLLTVEQLQKKYPKIQLSGLVRDYNEEYGVMKRIGEFAFATESAHPPEWVEDPTDVEGEDDEIEGGVFVNRRYYGEDLPLPGGGFADDEDHEDSESDSDVDSDDDDQADGSHDDEHEIDGFGVVEGEEIVFDDDDEVDFSDDEDDFVSDDEIAEIDEDEM